MGIINNNIAGVHFPSWEQLPLPAPAASTIGTCTCHDGKRFIYMLISATSFWRLDTWTGVPEQLANPTGGPVGAGTCMTYCTSLGKIVNGQVYGSILALITSGTGAPVFNKYDEATNAWGNLNVTNLPATFGTEGYLCFPEPDDNNFETYHPAAINTITLAADAILGATTLSVTALPKAIPANTILNFGTKLDPKYVHVTAAAAAAATSLTITASICALTSGMTALYYDHVYLVGNNAQQMYRWQHTTSAWATTSANSGNPAIPVVTGSVGAGGSLRWLPGETFPAGSGIDAKDKLVVIRGGGTSALYLYDLVLNTFSPVSYNPATESFSTGTSSTVRVVDGKKTKLYINLNGTQKFYRFNFATSRKEPIIAQEQVVPGAALVGDRTAIINHGGLDILYAWLSTSSVVVRTALWL